VFSPPYLFAGTRPTVTTAPSTALYNQILTIGTPDGATIQSVGLIRASSVTHHFNQTQRYVPLSFSAVAGGVSVSIPSDPNLVPPGHYMLFLVKNTGVPAVAPIVQLRGCG